MTALRISAVLAFGISATAAAAPVPVDLAHLGGGARIETGSQLLDSDVRDAIGGFFSLAEPGSVLYADGVQPQNLLIHFPEPVQIRTVFIEVTPEDPARMPERVEVYASSAPEGEEWSRISSDLAPNATPLVYDASDAVEGRRLWLDLGMSEDGVGARIREVKVYSVGRDVLFPQLAPQPHWSQAEHPGRIPLDAWGWQGPITYQRTYRQGEGFNYLRDRILDESYRRGANLFELYPPSFFPTSWPFDWRPGGLVERPDSYPYREDPRWRPETFRTLSRYAHSKGMLVQWFCHPEIVPRDRGEPTFTDARKISENLAALRKLALDYANAVRDPWLDVFDGYGHEHWFPDGAGLTARGGWEWNPGMYFYSTSNWRPFPEPAYSRSLMAAGSVDLRGRDDQWLLPPEKGIIPLSIQADCRVFEAPEEAWGGWSRFSGGTHPDWMLKQVNDFCRRRLMAGERPDGTALWWLGEPESVMPEAYRAYVYGISQDPIRCAVAGRLLTTGAMGVMDRAGRMGAPEIGARYDVPATAYFIQNNYLRLYRDATSDRTLLVYDPTRTAHFDADSEKVVLAADLLVLESEGISNDRRETIWKAGVPDGSSAEFRPRFEMLEGGAEPFDPARHQPEGRRVLTVGRLDGQSSELLPEGGFRDREEIDVRDAVLTGFPRFLGAPPQGPREVVLRLPIQAGTYRLEVGQAENAFPDEIIVALDGSPIGRLGTVDRATLEPTGFPNALLSMGPISIERDGMHELGLSVVGGDGFTLDALQLLYQGPLRSGIRRVEPYGIDEFVRVDGTHAGQVAGGVGRLAYTYPVNLHLLTDLEPGTYSLRVGTLAGEGPTEVQVFAGDQFVGAFVAEGGTGEKEIPFCVTRRGAVDLRISAEEGPGCGFDFLSVERTSGVYRSFEILEAAGYLASLRETVIVPTRDGWLTEVRRYAFASDTPILWLSVTRSGASASSARTLLRAGGYESAAVTSVGRTPEGGAGGPCTAVWRGEGLPNLVVRAEAVAELTAEGKTVRVSPGQSDRMAATMVVLDGLYEEAMVPGLPSVTEGTGPVVGRTMTAEGLAEENTSRIPEVRVLRLVGASGTPYFVEEAGGDGAHRWYFRGAQPSQEIPGTDLLKVYLPPGGRARVVPDAFLEGVARPGWGCQYIMGLGDLRRDGSKVSFTVDVHAVTPFVFSPRVEVAGRVRQATVDGRPYEYFDGNLVFLPNRRGSYQVEVTLGEPDRPHLTRTCAVVEEARWDGERGIFTVAASLPEWCPALPSEMMLAALVNLEGKRTAGVTAGVLAQEEDGRAVLWYRDRLEVSTR